MFFTNIFLFIYLFIYLFIFFFFFIYLFIYLFFYFFAGAYNSCNALTRPKGARAVRRGPSRGDPQQAHVPRRAGPDPVRAGKRRKDRKHHD
jgi:hypothetical protein